MKKNQNGFSLIEVMLAVAIIAMLSVGVLGMFQFALKVIAENKAREGAVSVANEISETIRNLSYTDVGTVGGLVGGVVPQEDTVTLNNILYTVRANITYVDDPFDGTVAAETDTLGNDYKKIRIAVSWIGHFGNQELISVTTVAPKGIETNEGGGVLRINVIDANGAPVPQASIHIINDQTIPTIDDDSILTDDDGEFLSAVPASNSSYQIVVTKNNYSSDYNCAIEPGGTSCSVSEGNPDPVKPRATILEGELTETTFVIDKISTLDIRTVSQTNIPTEWIVNTDSGNADQKNPTVYLGPDGNYYFAWQDFRNSAARIYSQNYSAQVAQFNPDLAVTTANNQNGPAITLTPAGNMYLVWFDDRNGNQDIYFDKYNSAGTELWGGSNKINTDASSADQLYPKIVSSPTTTSEFIFVAWKDNRAGGGASDIYLQKFDGNGSTLWGSELKVNFNASAYYQTTNSASWAFDNPSNYVCAGGNCDGATDIEVTGGMAQLVPIQSCQGTPDACDQFVTQTFCTDQSGCAWDSAGPCEGATCSCLSIDDETNCNQADLCSWQPGAVGCSGTCDCWAISNRDRCQSVSGCAWFLWFCYPTAGGCSCEDIENQNICVDADCGWEAGGGQCNGTCSCENITTQSVCSESSCIWDSAGPCSGTPNECTTFSDQTSCGNQQGCAWTETGGGYPSTNPPITPIESLAIANVLSWDSFTETATKNGGEIYYQLSNDDGSSWQYWNGSAWITAGATNYNTASVVNTNINQFSPANEKIMFKAFLSSAGVNQITLDQIDIGYTFTTPGGNFSQSVDLAVDQNENSFVVWETYNSDYDIFIQKINTTGNIIWSNDIQVNLNSSSDQTNPTLAIDSNGDIYIVWQDKRSGTNRIYAQKYDPNGNVLWVSGDLAVSLDASGNQQNPRIAINNSNNIFVVWQDTRNGDNDIYAQKLNTNGVQQWPMDIRINAETSGDQSNPDLILNQANNLVVTWQDNKAAANYDIIAVEYNGDPSSTSAVPYIPITITGAKKVGKTPVIYKFDQGLTTNASGQLLLTNMEWDVYSIILQGGSGYTIVSAEPPLPASLNPNSTLTVTLTLE